jgi:hypothetical protein
LPGVKVSWAAVCSTVTVPAAAATIARSSVRCMTVPYAPVGPSISAIL